MGVARRGAQFCYPAELAHGYLSTMLDMQADLTFLPHVKGFPSANTTASCSCVFVQGEPFYLRSAFPELNEATTHSPTIDFNDSQDELRRQFVKVAVAVGASARQGRLAFVQAMAEQEETRREMGEIGRNLLRDLEDNPEEIAIVLFGRSYNSFSSDANKGIPLKFASRGVRIIPFDMLPFDREPAGEHLNMYWATGSSILQCARFVAAHPRLFATYITNFSCGPDSFIITYFRDIMGAKPSLTLELDSHTADAGIETRVEAFLDIVGAYRALHKPLNTTSLRKGKKSAAMVYGPGLASIRLASGENVSLADKRVRMLIPAMGRFGTSLLAGAFESVGIKAMALPPADEKTLTLGRGNSSCKECLPLQTTMGSILHYLHNDRPEDEISAYFLPSAPGPCRFGQYNVLISRLIAQQNFANIAIFSPSSSNCYGGLGTKLSLAAYRAVIIGDLFDEMWATIVTAAKDKAAALRVLHASHADIRAVIGKDNKGVAAALQRSAEGLATISLTKPYAEIPKISLAGEIYVRHDPISLQKLVEKMAARGFIVRTAQNSEWLKYLDWLIDNNIMGKKSIKSRIIHWMKDKIDVRIRELLAPSGLFYHGNMQVKHLINIGTGYVSPHLRGEAILTVGSAFHDILNPSCGIIAIGPFGCMPSKVAEAVLEKNFTVSEKRKQLNGRALSPILRNGERRFPFLAIETDGTPFPQIIEARLEAFCLQAERLHREMLAGGH